MPLVSISDDQRRPIPRANWQATVYHGLPRDLHTFRDGPGDYLAFLGRISPEKGLDQAVEIARRAGMKLKSPPRSTRKSGRITSRSIEPLFRASPVGRVRRRSRRRGRRTSSWATPAPCCSRSTGRSRSAW